MLFEYQQYCPGWTSPAGFHPTSRANRVSVLWVDITSKPETIPPDINPVVHVKPYCSSIFDWISERRIRWSAPRWYYFSAYAELLELLVGQGLWTQRYWDALQSTPLRHRSIILILLSVITHEHQIQFLGVSDSWFGGREHSNVLRSHILRPSHPLPQIEYITQVESTITEIDDRTQRAVRLPAPDSRSIVAQCTSPLHSAPLF